MGVLEFIASVIDSLSWPLLILIGVVLLRAPISDALMSGPMKRFRAGPAGFEIEWGQKLEGLQTEAEAADLPKVEAADGLPTETPRPVAPDLEQELLATVDVSPRSAVLEAYSRLEAELRAVTPDPGGLWPVRLLAAEAVKKGLLREDQAEIVDKLTALRNDAAHEGSNMSAENARLYVDLVTRLIQWIEMALRNEAPPPE